MSAAIGPKRDRKAPFRFLVSGKVSLPATLAGQKAAACQGGRVLVTVKAGRRKVATRRASLDSSCGYQVTVRLSKKAVRKAKRLTFTVRFLGNAQLKARSAKKLTARVG